MKTNRILNTTALSYVVLVIMLIGNLYYIMENKKLGYQILSVTNAFQKEKEANLRTFQRELQLKSVINDIQIPHYRLDEIADSDSYLLLYFYSGGECEKCIFDDLEKIKSLILTDFPFRVFVFPIFNSSREIEIKLEYELKGIDFTRLNKEEVILPSFQGIQARFFALLTPEGQLIDYFFPDMNQPERLNVYLKYIKENYFESRE